jgi:hypothetical protein
MIFANVENITYMPYSFIVALKALAHQVAAAQVGYQLPTVRCAFSGRFLHSMMPLDPTHVRLKRAGV